MTDFSPAFGERARAKKKVPLRRRLVRAAGWAGFVGGGLVTPRLAAKAAARVWCKLPQNAGRRKDNRPEPGAIGQVDVGLISPVAVEEWGDPDGPLVYLVHGWGGWRGQVAAFVTPLVAAGCRVIGFDCLSHGDSGPGEHGKAFSSGGEMITSLEAVTAHFGQPHGIIAHSLGCANVCRAILDGKLTVDRLTLVSPSPDMRLVAANFAKSLGFRQRATRMLTEEMEKRAHRQMGDFDIADMGRTGQLPDALLIHDAADKESPYAVSLGINAAWEGARLMSTEGLGHHRILIDPAVIEAAAANVVSAL
ncbi:MAG: alpha/beta hydrolase [Bifidobacteriaceae bacterium]|jgi:pimeloyl-ACP methyl ester carboxylesterase|nr:alpha/beta hydrolase [Bifidobacteriaceae bacterium]